MKIERDGDNVSMVLDKQDMIELKALFDNHMIIPKYGKSYSGGPVIATTSTASTKSLWPGIKNWYNQSYNQTTGTTTMHPGQWQIVTGNPAKSMYPLDYDKPEDTYEILGKLIRAFDLILENNNMGGKAIE